MRIMVKKSGSSPLRLKSRVRGIALTVEMVLLITAIIVMSIVAYFGMSRMVLSQATSQKSTLVAIRAEAYMLSSNALAASIWVQNVGADTVTISTVGISLGSGSSVDIRTTTPPGGLIVVRPGETKVISFSMGSSAISIAPATAVYVFVRTVDGVEVGTATRIASP